MKYSTMEALQHLQENPDAVFKCIYGDGKLILKSDTSGNVKCCRGSELLPICLTDRWMLQRKPVTFMEAAKAFDEDGKTICVEFLSHTTGEPMKNVYEPLGENHAMCAGDELTFYLIVHGKWFIKED